MNRERWEKKDYEKAETAIGQKKARIAQVETMANGKGHPAIDMLSTAVKVGLSVAERELVALAIAPGQSDSQDLAKVRGLGGRIAALVDVLKDLDVDQDRLDKMREEVSKMKSIVTEARAKGGLVAH